MVKPWHDDRERCRLWTPDVVASMSASMTQNIYDNDEFFQNYGQMRRSLEGLAGAQEWPVMRSMLPELNGARVLDLGCGYGWFCRWARESGAASVLGVDVSEKMLARARETTSDAAIEYRRADLETIELEGMDFDLVYSSLTFHYVVNFHRLIDEIEQSLVGPVQIFEHDNERALLGEPFEEAAPS